MLGNFAFFFGGNRDSNSNPLGIVGVLVAMIVAPLAAAVVQMAISRTREYAADRRGAEISGKPLSLASALDKIARNVERIHNPDAEHAPATAHLFIINPLSGQRMDNLFSTHPDTANRIAALEAMAAEGMGMSPTRAAPAREAVARTDSRPRATTTMSTQSGPWGESRADTEASPAQQPERPKANPWGRNPTGPKGRRSKVARQGGHRDEFAKPRHGQTGGADLAPGLAARMAAARLLAAVVEAKTPLDGLTDNEHGHPQFRVLDMRDRSLVRAILATSLRFRRTIAALIAARLDNALPGNAKTLVHILHVAAAQILFLDIPDSAAVDLAVTHAKADPRTARFSGLVNGLLRSLARGKEADLPKALAATVDAPDWFIKRLESGYGNETAKQILALHRLEGATDFTVKADAGLWAEKLGGIVLPTGSVRVARLAGLVAELPGFAEGAWWVQDAAAALPARLFGDLTGQRVADLCAAPGGKTAQLIMAGANVTAVDSSKNRAARLAGNLARLGLEAEIVVSDAQNFAPTELFDAVLLDAPCSSTGTVRRHPDVLWTKTPEDVAKLADLQRRLLDAAIKVVRPGGRLVFSNCSLDPLEGEELVRRFLAETPGVSLDPVLSGEIAGFDPYLSREGWLRTTPADLVVDEPVMSGMDGFFAVRLRRDAAA